jgi:hypothetical protein
MRIDTADWRAVLRSALDHGAGADAETLAPEDVLAMRRAVVAAARDATPGRRRRRSLAIAATVVLTIAAGVAVGRRFETREPAAARRAEPGRPAGGEQLQLQFATPGGTRIIWVFNSDLDLKARTP